MATPAIQAWGKIGTDANTAQIIQLMASPNSNIAATAATVVRQKTKIPFDFDASKPVAARAEKAKQVKKLWERSRSENTRKEQGTISAEANEELIGRFEAAVPGRPTLVTPEVLSLMRQVSHTRRLDLGTRSA